MNLIILEKKRSLPNSQRASLNQARNDLVVSLYKVKHKMAFEFVHNFGMYKYIYSNKMCKTVNPLTRTTGEQDVTIMPELINMNTINK